MQLKILYSKYILFQFNFFILKILNFNLQFFKKATFQIANPLKYNYNKGESGDQPDRNFLPGT